MTFAFLVSIFNWGLIIFLRVFVIRRLDLPFNYTLDSRGYCRCFLFNVFRIGNEFQKNRGCLLTTLGLLVFIQLISVSELTLELWLGILSSLDLVESTQPLKL